MKRREHSVSRLDIEIDITRRLKERVDTVFDDLLSELLAERREALEKEAGTQ